MVEQTRYDVWTYASANSVTAPGNLTGTYKPGMRVALKQTTMKYFEIVSATYSSPNTTIVLDGYGIYSIANATITAHMDTTESNPKGFPVKKFSVNDVSMIYDPHTLFVRAVACDGELLGTCHINSDFGPLFQIASTYLEHGQDATEDGRGTIRFNFVPYVYIVTPVHFSPGMLIDGGGTKFICNQLDDTVFSWGHSDYIWGFYEKAQTGFCNATFICSSELTSSTLFKVWMAQNVVRFENLTIISAFNVIDIENQSYYSLINHVHGTNISGKFISLSFGASTVAGPNSSRVHNCGVDNQASGDLPVGGVGVYNEADAVTVSDCWFENVDTAIENYGGRCIFQNNDIYARVVGIKLGGISASVNSSYSRVVGNSLYGYTTSGRIFIDTSVAGINNIKISENNGFQLDAMDFIFVDGTHPFQDSVISGNTVADGLINVSKFFHSNASTGNGGTWYLVFNGNVVGEDSAHSNDSIFFDSARGGWITISGNQLHFLAKVVDAASVTNGVMVGNSLRSIGGADVVGAGWISEHNG